MGYQGLGKMENFDNYLATKSDKQREMIVYQDAARKMAQGWCCKITRRWYCQNLLDNPDNFIPLPIRPGDGFKTQVFSSLQAAGAAGGQAQPRELSQSYVPEGGTYTGKNMGEAAAERLQTPEPPAGATVTPVGTEIQQNQLIDSKEQWVK